MYNLLELLILGIITAIGIRGVYETFENFEWTNRIRGIIGSRLPDFVNPPLWGCPVCMTSLWGGSSFMLYSDFGISYLALYIAYLLGLQFIISAYVEQHQ